MAVVALFIFVVIQATAEQPSYLETHHGNLAHPNPEEQLLNQDPLLQLLAVVAPSGGLGFGIGDGQMGPQVTFVQPNSPLADVIDAGDLIIAVDDILTCTMLSFHVASMLKAKEENPIRKLIFLPMRTIQPPSNPIAALMNPRDLQLYKFDGEMNMDIGSQSNDVQHAQVSIIDDGRTIPVPTDCKSSPKILTLVSSIEKALPAHANFVDAAASTTSFCNIRMNGLFQRFMFHMFGCNALWDPTVSCNEIRVLVKAEFERAPSSPSSLLPISDLTSIGFKTAMSKMKIPPAILTALVMGTALAMFGLIVLIFCGYIDCIKLLLSDQRLKTDVKLLGESTEGLKWYEFEYLPHALTIDSSIVLGKKYCGVLAQELVHTSRAAAVSHGPDGYYQVDYARIGNCPFQDLVHVGIN
jgi:hypothetical protein